MGIRTDGEQLVTGGRDGGVHIWNVNEVGKPGRTTSDNKPPVARLVEGHAGEVGPVDCAHDVVATCSDDTQIRIWPYDGPPCV